jgi:hypothetical protein
MNVNTDLRADAPGPAREIPPEIKAEESHRAENGRFDWAKRTEGTYASYNSDIQRVARLNAKSVRNSD